MAKEPVCKTKYGFFTPDGLEYVVTRPDTPKPWVNHLSNERYCAMVSHTGGGYAFVDDSGYNRILREQPGDEIITDRPGRYLYLRDNDTGEYWSAGWQPVQTEPSFWEARHGLGYTQISSVYHEVQSSLRFFVPLEGTHEFWMCRLKNLSWKKKNLTLFTYVEWCLGNYYSDLLDRSFDVLFNKTEFDRDTILATKTRWIRPDRKDLAWDKYAFLYSNLGVDSYDCNKAKFLGPFHYLKNPQVVERGECFRSSGDGVDAVGVLSKKITLKPGQEVQCDFCLGTVLDKTEVESIRRRFTDHAEVEKEWQNLQLYWQNYLNKIKVETPDEKFNISVNFWNKYQTWITPHWSEMDSFYISGGATYGFRDECQHIMGILPHDAAFSEKKLVYLLEHQLADGKVLHNFDVLTDQGGLTGHADDCQWLVMAILNQVEETGNLSFLEQTVKFHDRGEAPVSDHLIRAMDYTLSNRSERKLALHRTADWNDAMTGGHLGKGESMMVSNQACLNLLRLIPLLRKIGQAELARKYEKVYEEMKKSLNDYTWDGGWYIRSTCDDGEVVGSKDKMEGKIFLNAQTWPVLSGVADQSRGKQAMDAVGQHLMTPYGPCLFLPSFTQLNSDRGVISQFSPGTKENGTIFNHPVSWAIIAETILGRGDKAYEYWQRTSFITRGEEPELYKAEPYVYAEFVYGPESQLFGEGSFTWTTGSAAWFFRACLDWIIGLRPCLEGLLIDPCVPGWKKFKAKRTFRGSELSFVFKNPDGVFKGVRSVEFDGKKITGTVITEFPPGKHLVKVTMGKT